MSHSSEIQPKDIAKPVDKLGEVYSLMVLSAPYDKEGMEPDLKEPKDSWKTKFCASLDGFIALDTLVRPSTSEEEDEFVQKFINGLAKLFADSNNNFLQPLQLTMDYCAKCNTCSEACHVFEATNRHELYRPIFRSEVFRKIYKKYFTPGGKLLGKFVGADIDINWESIARLGELAYRCNLCRRCAQTCPLGLDNGTLTHEIRKIFSQEMGIAPTALHTKGTELQLKTGSSTGMNKLAFLDTIEFLEEEIEEKTGRKIKIPIDKKGADFLLTHNAGEYLAWPENPAAFAILFEEAGLNWTLSSSMIGYDNVNYGIWYDDTMARKVALQQFEAAKELGIQRIVIGECGHAHKAGIVSSDRMTYGEDKVRVESCLPLLWELVETKRLTFNPEKNNFPVTLHDPCNIVRHMGIVQPQRNILKAICPQFREMTPHGVDNYCCGGGSGFAVMQSLNFPDFRNKISTRMKFQQILNAFDEELVTNTDIVKYVCAPCSNCKGAIRDMLEYYQATDRFNIHYGGLVELMVNALTTLEQPYLTFTDE
ncbi:(Fe-S)-binding protein [Dehalobacter sp. DCM]|uniref:(Fe-S)-binding protein n=1 Tax=Dehalobacter sp. DCM TaxID=2907827 RepID=UPI003081F878|nr:(Fe-S)-binding protein [Dehalobacter sp. DCM]